MPRLITASMGTQADGGHGFAERLPRTVSAENHETNRLVAALAAAQFRACIRTSPVPRNARSNSGHTNLPQSEFSWSGSLTPYASSATKTYPQPSPQGIRASRNIPRTAKDKRGGQGVVPSAS